jgi:dihydroneopterin aldolase
VSEVFIEIEGLELQGFHGATPEEKKGGQPFVFDVTLVAHDAGIRTDQLGDTIDYTKVVACVRDGCGQSLDQVEAVPLGDLADAIIERFDVSRVRVRVRKPKVVLEAPAAHTAATVERTRS